MRKQFSTALSCVARANLLVFIKGSVRWFASTPGNGGRIATLLYYYLQPKVRAVLLVYENQSAAAVTGIACPRARPHSQPPMALCFRQGLLPYKRARDLRRVPSTHPSSPTNQTGLQDFSSLLFIPLSLSSSPKPWRASLIDGLTR